MLRETYPYYLANRPVEPNHDLTGVLVRDHEVSVGAHRAVGQVVGIGVLEHRDLTARHR